jgi:hypothetical protein
MANFSQLRRRQSSREVVYRTQFSIHSDEALAERDEDAEGGGGGITFGAAASGPSAAAGRSFTMAAGQGRDAAAAARNRRSFKRQMSQAPNADEMGELMWDMRSRSATSAGELKRKNKKLKMAERERKEVSCDFCTFVSYALPCVSTKCFLFAPLLSQKIQTLF